MSKSGVKFGFYERDASPPPTQARLELLEVREDARCSSKSLQGRVYYYGSKSAQPKIGNHSESSN